MAYVPPHLRNKKSPSPQVNSSPRSLESLQKSTKSSSNPIYTLDDLSGLLGCGKKLLSTLTITISPGAEQLEPSERNLDDDVLRAIILFEGQHPEWQIDHKILCKSNLRVLHKLMGDHESIGDSTFAQEAGALDVDYPLFREIPFMKSNFEFIGWWRMEKVEFLAPGSAELVALFEKKFGKQTERSHKGPFSAQRAKPRTRTEEAWRDSLSREWAVVKLAQNHAKKDQFEPPLKLPSNNGRKLSNELGLIVDNEQNVTVRDAAV